MSDGDNLHGNHIRSPRSWLNLSYIKQDWLGGLAINLILGGLGQETRHEIPEGVSVGVVISLSEVEGSRAISSTSGKAVTHSGPTCCGGLSVGGEVSGDSEVGHVHEKVANIDGSSKEFVGGIKDFKSFLELMGS